LPIEKSTAKTELEIGSENCIAADSEIEPNYVVVDLKISN
jgi:hypothetical protein